MQQMRVMQIPKGLTEEQINELVRDYGVKVFRSAREAHIYEEVVDAYEYIVFNDEERYKDVFSKTNISKDCFIDETVEMFVCLDYDADIDEIHDCVKERLEDLIK